MGIHLSQWFKFLRAIMAYTLAGLLVAGLWSHVASPFGYGAGFVAELVIIGPTWYLNHYRGFIPQPLEAATVDIGLAIGTTVLVRDALSKTNSQVLESLPTLFSLLLGAVFAGYLVAYLRKKK